MKKLIAALIVLALPLTAGAQPDYFPGPDSVWTEQETDVQKYSNGDGGFAWLYPKGFGRVVTPETARIRCPGMIEGHYWTLSAITDSAGAVSDAAQALVENGESADLGMLGEMIECIDAFSKHLDTLGLSDAGMEKTWTYATECRTQIENAVVHVPQETTLAQKGDTLAVYRGDTCVGHGVWQGGASLAAAGTDDLQVSPDGYAEGDTIRLEVYDTSEGVAYRPEVGWTCDALAAETCTPGVYQDDAIFYAQVAEVDH